VHNSLGIPRERLDGLQEFLKEAAETKITTKIHSLKAAVQSQQKELSRSIVPIIKETMIPAYNVACEERGTGSHLRRKAVIESKVEENQKAMFANSIQPVLKTFGPVMKDVEKELTRCLESLIEDLRVNYAVMWEEAGPGTASARQAMQPKLIQ
jgi:hypothetical protein